MNFTSVENKQEYSIYMVEGDYEAQLIKAEEKTSQSGSTYLSFEFVVREDVEQRYKKKHVWRSYFKDESGEYNADRIGKLISALGVPVGVNIEIEDLVGRCCIIHVKPYTSTKTGKTSDSIMWYAKTKAGQLIKSFEEFTEVKEDEEEGLPF